MGAPKGRARPDMEGNKYAKGCTTNGVPKIYTDDWITEEAKLFREWMQKPDSLYFMSFAVERGYDRQRFNEFAECNKDFADAYSYAKIWQEQKLVKCGLMNQTNSSLTKFVLQNCHGWAERSTVTHKGKTLASELLDETHDDNAGTEG
jgi:hypothetical protein